MAVYTRRAKTCQANPRRLAFCPATTKPSGGSGGVGPVKGAPDPVPKTPRRRIQLCDVGCPFPDFSFAGFDICGGPVPNWLAGGSADLWKWETMLGGTRSMPEYTAGSAFAGAANSPIIVANATLSAARSVGFQGGAFGHGFAQWCNKFDVYGYRGDAADATFSPYANFDAWQWAYHIATWYYANATDAFQTCEPWLEEVPVLLPAMATEPWLTTGSGPICRAMIASYNFAGSGAMPDQNYKTAMSVAFSDCAWAHAEPFVSAAALIGKTYSFGPRGSCGGPDIHFMNESPPNGVLPSTIGVHCGTVATPNGEAVRTLRITISGKRARLAGVGLAYPYGGIQYPFVGGRPNNCQQYSGTRAIDVVVPRSGLSFFLCFVASADSGNYALGYPLVDCTITNAIWI